MGEAKFNLRLWSSNCQQLRTTASCDHLNDPNADSVNILGLKWNTLSDTLSYTLRSFRSLTSSQLVTKRETLRESTQIYDSLGLLTPVNVKAKILVQMLWQQKLAWDEPLNQDLAERWSNISTDIQEATSIVHPRLYLLHHSQPTAITQIHVFTDASLSAYGAVVYLRQDNCVALVMSRSRVSPVKSITLPKLELMAAVIGTRLAKFVVSSLRPVLADVTIHMWTDSQITLYWIYDLKQSTQSKSFIANRVSEIKRHSLPLYGHMCQPLKIQQTSWQGVSPPSNRKTPSFVFMVHTG